MVEPTLKVSGIQDSRRFAATHRKLYGRVTSAADELGRTTRRIALKEVHVITHALRNSLAVYRDSDHVRTVYADTPYAAIEEFGFTGIMIIGTFQRLQTHVYGRPVSPFLVQVRAHTRFVNRPPHPYMRPAFLHAEKEARPIVTRHLKSALR